MCKKINTISCSPIIKMTRILCDTELEKDDKYSYLID